MAAKEVKVNYTEAQTAELRAAYLEALGKGEKDVSEMMAAFAEKFGKTTRSLIAKLTREGVYKAKEYKTKAGEAPVKKDAHADAIGAILKLSEGDTDSLAKANKRALEAIFKALANSKPIDGDE